MGLLCTIISLVGDAQLVACEEELGSRTGATGRAPRHPHHLRLFAQAGALGPVCGQTRRGRKGNTLLGPLARATWGAARPGPGAGAGATSQAAAPAAGAGEDGGPSRLRRAPALLPAAHARSSASLGAHLHRWVALQLAQSVASSSGAKCLSSSLNGFAAGVAGRPCAVLARLPPPHCGGASDGREHGCGSHAPAGREPRAGAAPDARARGGSPRGGARWPDEPGGCWARLPAGAPWP